MCVICYIPKRVEMPPLETMEHCWQQHGDGAGIVAINKKGNFQVARTTKLKSFRSLYNHYQKEYNNNSWIAIHFRKASVGEVSIRNIHPFKINDNLLMMHNGTLKIKENKDKQSDSLQLASFLGGLPLGWENNGAIMEMLMDNIGSLNRIVLLSRIGEARFLNADRWIKDGDITWSNDSYVIKPTRKDLVVIDEGFTKCSACNIYTNNNKVTITEYGAVALCHYCYVGRESAHFGYY